MSPRTPRKDPRIIRAALEFNETHGVIATVEQFNTDAHSLYRWRRYRAAAGPQWPTDADIADWEAKAPARARRAKQRHRSDVRRHLNQGPFLLDATGTIRRLQALGALGHSQQAIGAALGITAERVSQLARGISTQVFPRTAKVVSDLYREWCMVVPTGRAASSARTYAKRKHWAPPLAWDDDLIDDPTAQPAGVGVNRPRPKTDLDPAAVLRKMLRDEADKLTLTQAERTEVCRRLRAEGWSDGRIEEHTGLKVDRYLPKQTAVAA